MADIEYRGFLIRKRPEEFYLSIEKDSLVYARGLHEADAARHWIDVQLDVVPRPEPEFND